MNILIGSLSLISGVVLLSRIIPELKKVDAEKSPRGFSGSIQLLGLSIILIIVGLIFLFK